MHKDQLKKTSRNLFLSEILIVYLFKIVFYFTGLSPFLTIVLCLEVYLNNLQPFLLSSVKRQSTDIIIEERTIYYLDLECNKVSF